MGRAPSKAPSAQAQKEFDLLMGHQINAAIINNAHAGVTNQIHVI